MMQIEMKYMMKALHREHGFSDMFVAYLLTRNIRYEEDLVDQLFNSSEKRLARHSPAACALRQRRKARSCDSQDQSGDAGRNGGHRLAGEAIFS